MKSMLKVLFVAACFVTSYSPVTADDAQPKSAVETWQELKVRRESIVKELATLRSSFATAPPADRLEIAQKFRTLANEYNQEVGPNFVAAAEAAFAEEPTLVEAGEMAAQAALGEGRYQDASNFAEKVLAQDADSAAAGNAYGVSNFALHNFEKADEVLSGLAAKGQLDQQGERFAEPASEYGEFWNREQKLRAAQAALGAEQQLPQIELITTKGRIVCELFEEEAPNTVANFVSLIESGFYNGIQFHRVIPNFMIQGGDPLTLNDNPSDDGTGGPGYNIDCECYAANARKHFRGTLSMAHAGKDSGGSQFFITHLPTHWLNANPKAQSGHTAFGRVLEGFDVLDSIKPGDKIESAKVLRKRNHEYKPVTHPE
ncbi:peptidylprolyl isomerase [Calycomorphotria hydatis]|nr:peptidylprolyl isomerase [Calycomorphotria hydatis]